MGGCANIAGVVLEDQVFEMDELAVDPQRGTGVGKMGSFDPAIADGRARNPFVQAREGETVWLLLPDFNPGNVIRQLGSGAKLATIFR